MGQKLLDEKPEKVWESVFGYTKLVTGDVDVVGKGTLQEQIDTVISEINTQDDSVSVIDDTGRTITTTYADGTSIVINMDDTSMIENVYNAGGGLTARTGIYMDGNKIEIKELGVDEE